MESQFSTVSKILPTLSIEELSQIRITCESILNLSKSKKKEQEEDWLLDGIIYELGSRGLGTYLSPGLCTSSKNSSKRIRELFEAKLKDLNIVEKRQLGRLLSHCLAKYISEWIQISSESMIRSINQIPQAFNKSFPDYLNSNLLIFLIRSSNV